MENLITLRLFLLPYAGANKYSYKFLESSFPPNIQIHALELPGRGRRFTESLLTNLKDGAKDIYDQMEPYFHEPYAIFGHSMGAVLGYMVTRKILASGFSPPIQLFCSGRSSLWSTNPEPWYELPSADFWNKIIELGGLPDSSQINDEMKVLFEPILRADFRMIQSVEKEPRTLEPIDIPITVVLGKEDKLTQNQSTWQQQTTACVDIHYMEGGHFYFLENGFLLACQIQKVLMRRLKKTI